MARIPLIESEQASPEVRKIYDRMGELGFPVFNVMKVFANDAAILEGFFGLVKPLYGEPLIAPRYRELAYLRASQINNCHY